MKSGDRRGVRDCSPQLLEGFPKLGVSFWGAIGGYVGGNYIGTFKASGFPKLGFRV